MTDRRTADWRTDLETAIERALTEHRMDDEARACTCGVWRWEPGSARPGELHRMHLAAAVIDALLLEFAGYDTFRGVKSEPLTSGDEPLFRVGVLKENPQ